jgi:hypothetical protein
MEVLFKRHFVLDDLFMAGVCLIFDNLKQYDSTTHHQAVRVQGNNDRISDPVFCYSCLCKKGKEKDF